MRKLKYPIILSAFAASSVLFAADYTFDVGNGDFNNTSSWKVGGETATQLPTYEDNLIFTQNNNVAYNFDDPSTNLLRANNIIFNGNLIDLASKGWISGHASYSGTQVEWIAVAPSIDAKGNVTVNSGTNFGNGYSGSRGYGFKSISIGGNLILNAQAFFTWLSSDYTYSSDDPSLRVQGQVIISGNSKFQVEYGSRNKAYVKIGGLVGTNGRITNGNEGTGISTIEFTQNDGGVFVGGDFKGFVGAFGQDSGGFNLIMNDTSGGSSKQIMRFDLSAKGSSDKVNNITVSVKAGSLSMYSNGDDGLTTLSLTGGTFGIAGSNSEARTGMAKFSDDFTWTAGKIEITADIDNMEADVLEVNNLILAGSDATYEFVFDMLGNFDETTEMHLNILTLTGEGSTFGDDIISKLVGKTSDGLYNAIFSLNAGNNKLYLDGFSQIPEPAEVAAFIGAVALAFAAWRRRK